MNAERFPDVDAVVGVHSGRVQAPPATAKEASRAALFRVSLRKGLGVGAAGGAVSVMREAAARLSREARVRDRE